jgi:hypothetical protein
MTRLASLTLLATLSCCTTLPVYTQQPQHEGLVVEAAQAWGLRAKLVEAPGPGVLVLDFRPHEGTVCGRALDRAIGAESVVAAITDGIIDCSPAAWSCVNVTFLTHELGHEFGLSHRGRLDDPRDAPARNFVMHPAPNDGAVVEPDQVLVVQTTAAAWSRACRVAKDQVAP